MQDVRPNAGFRDRTESRTVENAALRVRPPARSVRPISGGFNPYAPRPAHSRSVAAWPASAAGTVRRVEPVAPPVPLGAVGDVEVSVRMFADGRSISVRRRTVAEADGTRRTVGIDAVVR